MEYLLSQTGEPLAPLCPEEEEEFQEEAEEDEHEDEEEEEEEEDEVDCDPTVVVEPESPASLAPPPASPSPPPLPLPDVSSASPAPPLISSSPPHLVPMEQPVEVELERLESPLLEQVQDEILAAAATVSRLSTVLNLCKKNKFPVRYGKFILIKFPWFHFQQSLNPIWLLSLHHNYYLINQKLPLAIVTEGNEI